MLMTVEELKQYITTDKSDTVLEAMLQALELTIRRYTNNNFQNRGFRVEADIRSGVFMSESLIPFEVGDTIMVSESDLQSDCLAVVKEVNDLTFTTDSEWADEDAVLVTKVVYPADVKLGAANIIDWQLRNQAMNSGDTSNAPVASETISRHSVTYVTDASEADLSTEFGVPRKHVAFLKGYKKARF